MPESAKKVDEQNLTLLPKAIKNPVEVANIRQAHIKDGIALTKFMYWLKKNIGKVPMTEISAAEKMESYSDEIAAVKNGKTKKDTPFIIATLEIMAKGLRQQDKEFSEIADSLERTFSVITILK